MASPSHLGSAPPSFSRHSLCSSPAPAWDQPLFLLCCRSLSLAFLSIWGFLGVWGCADPSLQVEAPMLEHFGCSCCLWCLMPSAALSLLHLCHLSRSDGEISVRLLPCSASPQPGAQSLPKPSLLRAALPSTAGYETSVREKPRPDVAGGCCDHGLSTAVPGLLVCFFP